MSISNLFNCPSPICEYKDYCSRKINCPKCGRVMTSLQEENEEKRKREWFAITEYRRSIIENTIGRKLSPDESIDDWNFMFT